jgi:hypothetical protein
MGKVIADISMSLDGFVAGPHDGLGRGLGDGGEPIHNCDGRPVDRRGPHPRCGQAVSTKT